MTSFFDKIAISTDGAETVLWSRNRQPLNPLLEVPSKLPFVKSLTRQQAKVASITGCQPFQQPASMDARDAEPTTSRRTNDIHDGVAQSTPADMPSQPFAGKATTTSDELSLQLVDSVASEGLIKALADCDGLEYASEGDKEQVVQIVLFPSYEVPHFAVIQLRW